MISRHYSRNTSGHRSRYQSTGTFTGAGSPAFGARHLVMLCAVFAVSFPAAAGELMPFEVPEEEVQWDQIELDEFKVDPTLPVAETPASVVEPGPDWPAPAIDAYFDIAFADADFAPLGYPQTQGGYRFIVGFRFDGLLGKHWTVAPEFGYTRIGLAERKQVSVDNTDPNYTITTTDKFNTDLSALDFGARLGRLFMVNSGSAIRPEIYARAGLQFYHSADKTQRTLDFTPKNSNPVRPSQVQQPASVADAKVDLYGAVGASLQLGKVPSIYAEYAARRIAGEFIEVTSVGVLLNF